MNKNRLYEHPNRVQWYRKHFCLSLLNLSNLTGIPMTTLEQIEAGCNVTLGNMKKLTKFFGKSLDELFGD